MNVTLTSELEKLVKEKVGRGDYETADALVQEAVQRLIEEDEQRREALRRDIQDGLDEIDRGEYTEYDEHTIKKLAKEVHERGMKRLGKLPKTGTR